MMFSSSDSEPLNGVGSWVALGLHHSSCRQRVAVYSVARARPRFGRTSRRLRLPPRSFKFLFEGAFISWNDIYSLSYRPWDRAKMAIRRVPTGRVEGISRHQIKSIQVIQKRLWELDPGSG